MAYDILGLACRGKDGVAFADLEDLRRPGGETFQSVLGRSGGRRLPEERRPRPALPLEPAEGMVAETPRKGLRPMIRRRLYNPAQLTPEELKATFVAREETLAEMLRVTGEQVPGRPCQHMMLIGPRGMGKTTLGLRFLYAVGDDAELSAQWQPVAFHEESYGIGSLAEFWLAALQHLTRATGILVGPTGPTPLPRTKETHNALPPMPCPPSWISTSPAGSA